MRATWFALLPVVVLAAACEQGPELVYVPEGPPEVTLIITASARDVTVGQPVIVHAERAYRGRWKQVDRKTLPEGRCWVAEPPPAREREVADNVHWQVTPREPARFNTALRPDHSREVTFAQPGTYTVAATTAVWCGPNTGAGATPFTIRVRP